MTGLGLPVNYREFPIYSGDVDTIDYHAKSYAPCMVVMDNFEDECEECVIDIEVSQEDENDDFEMIVSMPESEYLAYIFLNETPKRENISIDFYKFVNKGKCKVSEFEYQRNPFSDEMEWIMGLLDKNVEFYC